MKKRNYTHVQILLPEIKTMLAEGKTQREVAEYYGFKDKYVVKQLLGRERRKKESWRQELYRVPRAGRGNIIHQEIFLPSRHMKSSVYRWKTGCCGIFCNL